MDSRSFTKSTGKEERHLGTFIEKALLCRGDREWSFGAFRIQAEMGNNGALIHHSVNGPVDLFSFFRPLICP